MALSTQVIGQSMTHGYAGSYARQPDSVIDTHPMASAEDTTPITFGLCVVLDDANAVTLPEDTSTAAQFLGVAVREIKSATDYLSQSVGQYNPGDAVPIMKRGCVNVICQNGTPAQGGDVYLRVKANDSLPNAVVGGFEATADSTNSVKLTNCKWKGPADSNKVAEMRIMTIINA